MTAEKTQIKPLGMPMTDREIRQRIQRMLDRGTPVAQIIGVLNTIRDEFVRKNPQFKLHQMVTVISTGKIGRIICAASDGYRHSYVVEFRRPPASAYWENELKEVEKC